MLFVEKLLPNYLYTDRVQVNRDDFMKIDFIYYRRATTHNKYYTEDKRLLAFANIEDTIEEQMRKYTERNLEMIRNEVVR